MGESRQKNVDESAHAYEPALTRGLGDDRRAKTLAGRSRPRPTLWAGFPNERFETGLQHD